MTKQEVFQWLQIQETKDIQVIQEAYKEQLKNYHPEECPEEFMQLREALQLAIQFATSQEEPQISDAGEAFSDKILQLYLHYADRNNPQKWAELLRDPIVDDFDYAEEIRALTLTFFEEFGNFICNEVIAVIDEKYHFEEYVDELEDIVDYDFLDYLIGKKNGEIQDFDYASLHGYPEYDKTNQIDDFIGGLLSLMAMDYEEIQDSHIQNLADTGMQHPWFDLLQVVVRGAQGVASAQELYIEIEKWEEIPEEIGEASNFRLACLVNTLRYQFFDIQEQVSDAFYFIEQVASVSKNAYVLRNLEKCGQQVYQTIENPLENENTLVLFFHGIKCGFGVEKLCQWMELHRDEIPETEEFWVPRATYASMCEMEKNQNNREKTPLENLRRKSYYGKEMIWAITPYYEENTSVLGKLFDIHYERFHEICEGSSADAEKCIKYGDLMLDMEENAYNAELVDNMYTVFIMSGEYDRAWEMCNRKKTLLQVMQVRCEETGDPMLKEDFGRQALLLYWNYAMVYVLHRKKPTDDYLEKCYFEEANKMIGKMEEVSIDYENYYGLPVVWGEYLLTCEKKEELYWLKGHLLENKKILDTVCKKKAPASYREMLESWYECMIKICCKLKKYREARTYFDAQAQKLGVLQADVSDDELVRNYEEVINTLKYLVYAPKMFSKEEPMHYVTRVLQCIDRKTASLNNKKDVDKMMELLTNVGHYGLAISCDYSWFYELHNRELVIKHLHTMSGDNKRYYYGNLMNLCFFLGKQEEKRENAKKYLEVITELDTYCPKENVSLQEVVDQNLVVASRYSIVRLIEAYLYMDELELAETYLNRVGETKMCSYCKKHGCLEKLTCLGVWHLLKQDYEKAEEYFHLANQTEWDEHEEVAERNLLYMKMAQMVK